jgi:pimeloyl-ACP methyl ester carboxylesterase
MSTLHKALIASLTLLAAALGSTARAESFEGLDVQVVGQGRPVLMIPGLNSAGAVWTETCAALQPGVQCHIVQLPGFAGTPAVKADAYLEGMRDRLLAYVEARKLTQPVVMGHSLGGAVALMMGAQAPQRLDRLVIVDTLPFLAGIRNPAATAEAARAMASGMRAQMLQSSPEQWAAQSRAMAPGMTRDNPAGVQKILDWGLTSDRQTTAQAMSELWAADLRPLLPRIERPVLVLGSWAAYAPMGSTLESTRKIFDTQYAGLPGGAQVRMSERGYHFLMWDDASWLLGELRGFMTAPR